MRNFVLVHGAWLGGWCYSRVATILRSAGHNVFCPTLTGVGERSHLAHQGINCSTHILDVIRLIECEGLNDVTLCGHSYGGMVVGGVADAIPDRVASLVYLDAMIPEHGKSLVDLVCTPEQVAQLVNFTGDHGGWMLPPSPARFFNINPADEAMVDALCTPQPLATFCERLELKGGHVAIPKKTYVLATNWEPNHHRVFHEQVKDDPGWNVVETPCGHCVMFDEPERLAEILVESL